MSFPHTIKYSTRSSSISLITARRAFFYVCLAIINKSLIKGGNIMSKKSKLLFQFTKELSKETRYGESKHDAKELARKEAERTGEPYKQVKGIFSTSTFNNYKESCKTFSLYCIKNHSEVKNIEDCERYVSEYINDCRDRKLSEWTINKYAYALSCAYHKDPSELDIEKGTRSRKDIKRDREAEDHRLRQNEKYEQVVTLTKATGCRHQELLRLRKEDFRENEDGTMSVFKRGKGGIERWCLINPRYEEWVREYVKNKETINVGGEERLLRKNEAPNKLPLHDCRSDYAVDLYNYYMKAGYATGNIYHCRGDLAGYSYDKGVLAKVSYDLQHERNNVVIDYLWKDR